MHHIRGLEQLLAAHGPVTQASDPLVKILVENTRLTMIATSLYSRKPSLMSHPNWKADTPDQSIHDDGISYLLDGLAQLPKLYNLQDTLVAAMPKDKAAHPDSVEPLGEAPSASLLLSTSLELLNDIQSKRALWMNIHPKSEFPSLPTASSSSSNSCPFSIVTHFSSLPVANAFTFYNCLIVLINRFIVSIHETYPPNSRDDLAKELALDQVCIASTNILRSIDYHLPYTLGGPASMAQGSGPRNFYLLLPMRVAYQALCESKAPDAVSKRLWLKDVFDIIKARAGPWASNEQIFRLG